MKGNTLQDIAKQTNEYILLAKYNKSDQTAHCTSSKNIEIKNLDCCFFESKSISVMGPSSTLYRVIYSELFKVNILNTFFLFRSYFSWIFIGSLLIIMFENIQKNLLRQI